MDLFTHDHLDELLDVRDQPCISIYIPTHRAAPETAQDPIRLKNMLRAVHRELEQQKLVSREIREQMGLAESWLADTEFWRHQSDGLAVFLTPQSARRYRLPQSFEEQFHVDDRFSITPLLPLLQANGTFYVLAVSQNTCRLLVGSRDSLQELNEADLPSDLRSAVGRWRESELNLHSMQRKPQSRGGDDTALYHGHQEETQEAELQAYFRQIDAGVTDALNDVRAPLVFAGVGYLFPIYGRVNHYPGLCDQPVLGNPDNLTEKELHRACWDVVQPIFASREQQIIRQFAQRSAQGTATDDLATVLTAARDGLVETLIIPQGSRLPGRFDETSGAVALDGDGHTGDLLEQAVLLTLRTAGNVLAVMPERLPEGSNVLALLRAPQSTIAT